LTCAVIRILDARDTDTLDFPSIPEPLALIALTEFCAAPVYQIRLPTSTALLKGCNVQTLPAPLKSGHQRTLPDPDHPPHER
jgi:hypothetical protein